MNEEEKIRIMFHCLLEVAQSCKMRGCPRINPMDECWCMNDAETIIRAMEFRGIDLVFKDSQSSS